MFCGLQLTLKSSFHPGAYFCLTKGNTVISSSSRIKLSVTLQPQIAPATSGTIRKHLGTLLKSVASHFYPRPVVPNVSYRVSANSEAKISGLPMYRAAATTVSGLPPVNDMLVLQTQRMNTVAQMLHNDKVSFPNPGAIKAFVSLRLQMSTSTPASKDFKKCEKKLIALLAAYLAPEPGKAAQGQTASSRLQARQQQKQQHKRASVLYRAAVVRSLNEQPWNRIEQRFDVAQTNGTVSFISRLTPAGQMKLRGRNIFARDYAGRGVSSGSTKNTGHATNLWISEFHASIPGSNAATAGTANPAAEQTLFRGVRHGICSPYGLREGAARTEGALNRAREVVTAALFLDPEKLQRALNGQVVDLKISSTSLVTATNFRDVSTEGKQFDDQRRAFETLSNASPCLLKVRDGRGLLREVKVNLKTAAFNFGVNEAALNFKAGWSKSDKQNLQALRLLLGVDLRPGLAPGGWVGEYLSQPASQKNAAVVRQLSDQIREIWQQKSHRRDGGEPYKLAQRIALLSNAIGVVPCYNCKSGKDRTGMLDSELKREMVQLFGGAGLSVPGEALTAQQQAVFRDVLAHSGNLDIQLKNTGAPGNKVLKSLSPYGNNLSLRQRIGDTAAFDLIRGLSSSVKS